MTDSKYLGIGLTLCNSLNNVSKIAQQGRGLAAVTAPQDAHVGIHSETRDATEGEQHRDCTRPCWARKSSAMCWYCKARGGCVRLRRRVRSCTVNPATSEISVSGSASGFPGRRPWAGHGPAPLLGGVPALGWPGGRRGRRHWRSVGGARRRRNRWRRRLAPRSWRSARQ